MSAMDVAAPSAVATMAAPSATIVLTRAESTNSARLRNSTYHLKLQPDGGNTTYSLAVNESATITSTGATEKMLTKTVKIANTRCAAGGINGTPFDSDQPRWPH